MDRLVGCFCHVFALLGNYFPRMSLITKWEKGLENPGACSQNARLHV